MFSSVQVSTPHVIGQIFPDNLAPPDDPVLPGSHNDSGRSVVDVPSLSSLERSGFPVEVIDQQIAKRGKISDPVLEGDDSGQMEGSGSPKVSYARVVAGANKQTAVEPAPSLDAVIVNAGDVKVDRSGSSEDNNMSARIEKEVYGPWMLAPFKRRQPRKDTTRSKGPSSLPGSSGGSRFAILEDNVDTDLAPSNGRVGLVPESCPWVAKLQSDSRVVSDLSAIRGVAIGSRSVPGTIDSHEVAAGLAQRVQVVDSDGSQAPRVESHVVQNVAGNHSAISIIDVANEKRRQSLVNVGGRQVVSRKSMGNRLKANLRLRKGKENIPSSKPLLRDWLLPIPSTSSPIGSSGVGNSNTGDGADLNPHLVQDVSRVGLRVTFEHAGSDL
ncbi:hypothetical protein V6N12_048942 [Hibiscus sabdariffa]|uniref:Uncharacterized protein n=1 Tax=Hibiscus sabdariffa TaxID=183260 RepID=A0ABR2EMH8_9ROSI